MWLVNTLTLTWIVVFTLDGEWLGSICGVAFTIGEARGAINYKDPPKNLDAWTDNMVST